MPASVPSDPHRSPNSVDCHIDRGPLWGLLNHPSQALMACNEKRPGHLSAIKNHRYRLKRVFSLQREMPHHADRSEASNLIDSERVEDREPVPDYGDVQALSLFLLKQK